MLPEICTPQAKNGDHPSCGQLQIFLKEDVFNSQEIEEATEEESDHWDTLLQSESELESSLQPRRLHKDFLNAIGKTSSVRKLSRLLICCYVRLLLGGLLGLQMHGTTQVLRSKSKWVASLATPVTGKVGCISHQRRIQTLHVGPRKLGLFIRRGQPS